jgi:cell division protein FtsA
VAAPRIEKIITALDVGSWKVCALIAGQTADGQLHVLGTGQRQSRGLQRGRVVDMENAEQVVREAIEQAERIAGLNIDDVWVACSAAGMTSQSLHLEIDLSGDQIEQRDVDQLLELGRTQLQPETQMILHAQPALYTLDGLQGVRNPVGLHADRLGVDINIVMADGSPVRNLEGAVRQAHLDVNALVASPMAAGLSCLSEEERDLGVALVEIGGSVTTIGLYIGGMLATLTTLPVGAGDITDDIASAFGIRRSLAQRLQSFYGSANASPRDNIEMIDLDPNAPAGSDSPRITRAQLVGVITERLNKMMAEIGKALKDMHFTGPVGRQVVLVGGGADLKGMADYTQSALGRAVRVGRPQGLIGLPEAHAGPAFATLAGLVLYAAAGPVDLRDFPAKPAGGSGRVGDGLINRFLAALKNSF